MSSKKNDIKLASPKVRKFAREIGANLQLIKGTQRAGRIDEEDVKDTVVINRPLIMAKGNSFTIIPLLIQERMK